MTAKTLNGYYSVQGYFFDLVHNDEAAAVSRILPMWRPGIQVLRFPEALFVLFDNSKFENCQLAPAYPLIKQDNGYCSVEIGKPQLREALRQHQLDPGGVNFVVMCSGRLYCYELIKAEVVDLSQWLDVEEYTVLPVKPLGKLPDPPKVELSGNEKAVHDIFKDEQLKPSQEKDAFLHSLKDRNVGLNDSDSHKSPNLLQRIFSRFGGANKTGEKSNRGGKGDSGAADITRPGLVEKMRSFLQRQVMTSKLGKVLARRQAKYFRKMLDLFDSGDLKEALRHAVPLQSARDAFEQASSDPAFGLPSPRDGFDINFNRTASCRNYHFENEFYEHIRQLYRRSFEQLDRAGRYKEAAFVLAELLQESEEAVNYLEKKGELLLAAQLAEGRQVNPAIVIRQWVVAGNVERAISVATVTGAFSAAVNLLQASHPEEASKLRIIWGELLANAGLYGAAVDVVWPVPQARDLALRWLDAAIDEGGETGARMLARKIAIREHEYESLREKVSNLMFQAEAQTHSTDQVDAETARCRTAFISALLTEPTNAATRTIARFVSRALVRDFGSGLITVNSSRLSSLLELAGQRALRTDVPEMKTIQARYNSTVLRSLEKPKLHVFQDIGTSDIYDVKAVSTRRYLIALGEAGAQLVNQQGRLITRFAVPAYKLVMSDSANRVIALSRRGSVIRMAKLDLTRLTCQDWGEAQFDDFCDSFDGFTWCVSKGDHVMAIDTQSEHIKALWQIADLPGRVVSMSRNKDSIGLLIAGDGGIEAWRYEMPGFTLRQRAVLQTKVLNQANLFGFSVDHNATAYAMQLNSVSSSGEGNHSTVSGSGNSSVQLLRFKEENTPKLLSIDLPPGEIGEPKFNNDWALIPVLHNEGMEVYVIDIEEAFKGKIRLQVTLKNSYKAEHTIADNHLFIFDENGQIQVINLQDGALVWSHRA